MRELRTILEVMFPTLYLDFQYPNQNLKSKLKVLRELEEERGAYGKRAFELSGYDEWPRYYELYRKLCAYTHLSMNVTGRNIQGIGKYPPAEPGALLCEPLEAAERGR